MSAEGLADVEKYARAVEAMRELEEDDPRNWANQAAIHARWCPHFNWYFLPWHRAYLYCFEEICRDVLKDDAFALPYWAWERQTSLPPAFTENGPLKHERRLQPDQNLPPDFNVDYVDELVRDKDPITFFSERSEEQRQRVTAGGLESLHNALHVRVGGDMNFPVSAPLDPIFWVHHANVDRIWAMWSARPQNAVPDDESFAKYEFEGDREFVDRNKRPVSFSVGELFETNAAPLNYGYDDVQAPPAAGGQAALFEVREELSASATNERSVPLGRPLEVLIGGEQGANLPLGMFRELPSNAPQMRILIAGLEPPSDSSVLIRVYLNCDYLSVDTPVSDSHYVATLAFFGSDHDHGGEGEHTEMNDHDRARMASGTNNGGSAFVIDATQTLRDLAANRNTDPANRDLRVQFIAVSADEAEAKAVEILPRMVQVQTVIRPA